MLSDRIRAFFGRAYRGHGFSLVEVVLAIGILSFALIMIVALFASLSNRRQDVSQRREAAAAIAALGTYLNEGVSFETVYEWVQGGSAKELVYVRYQADEAENPSSSGSHVISNWFDPASADLVGYEDARQGYWMRALLTFDGNLHADSSLSASASDWPYAHLLLRAELHAVPDPGFTPGPQAVPITKTTIGVLR